MRSIRPIVCVGAVTMMASAGLAQTWNDEISADNPLHWYRLDETSGDEAIDYGSAGLDGIYINGPTLGASGLVGGAVAFDGIDDIVFLGDLELEGEWTAEFVFWCDPENAGPSQGLIGGLFTGLKAEQWQHTARVGYTEFGVADYTLNIPTPTTYTHLVYVNGATNIQVYVNGAFASANRKTILLSRDVIGAGNWFASPPTDPLMGEIDEAVIYDRALSAADIERHAATLPSSCPCDCNFDTSTGVNVCDVFDFLAFQNGFVSGEECAIDRDTSTGVGVADIFDFLEFQNGFVAGCP